jgi:AraC family transcriptional regulator
MNQLITYLRTPLISIQRFVHPAEEAHVDPEEETAQHHSVDFLERGGYDLQIAGSRWQMSPGLVFLTRPELTYRCRHDTETPTDVSFSVGYDERFLQGVAHEAAPPRPHASRSVIRLTNRLAYLHTRLRSIADNGDEVLAAETLAGELWRAVTGDESEQCGRPYNARTFAAYAERVEAARALMESDYGAPHTLFSLARFTGVSPFHFSRIFREFTGRPPHAYLLEVRLARAAERLRDGVGVTETCFATGFSNLSHFIRLFRRTFGVSPSRINKGMGKARPG